MPSTGANRAFQPAVKPVLNEPATLATADAKRSAGRMLNAVKAVLKETNHAGSCH
jgi:hypothetical protein